MVIFTSGQFGFGDAALENRRGTVASGRPVVVALKTEKKKNKEMNEFNSA